MSETVFQKNCNFKLVYKEYYDIEYDDIVYEGDMRYFDLFLYNYAQNTFLKLEDKKKRICIYYIKLGDKKIMKTLIKTDKKGIVKKRLIYIC